jgi:alpha-glucosidase
VLLYQGEELGLPEVDLRRDQLRDPVGDLYYPLFKGRDGCRTPMPWDAAKPNLGFSAGRSWLPLGAEHARLAAAAQEKDAGSTLSYTRSFLKARGKLPALIEGDLELLAAQAPLIAFIRGGAVLCAFNLGDEVQSWALPKAAREIPIGTGGAGLGGSTLTLPPLSAWFGQF